MSQETQDLFNIPLVFIDVETTGFSPVKNRITEVAAIRYQKGVITKKIVSLFNVGEPLHEKIVELTGITDAMLAMADEFNELVTGQLWSLFDDDTVLVAHNAKFDRSFVAAEFQRNGVSFTPQTLCTVEMARQLYPSWSNHKLETLISNMDLTFTDRHRAEDDAAALIQFIEKARAEHGDERVAEVMRRSFV